MPRPKRTKVQPSLPVSRRAGASTTIAPAATKQTNPARQTSSRADEENSDDSDGLVTSIERNKKQKKPTEGNDLTMMCGGLGLGDKRNAHTKGNAPKRTTGPNLRHLENPDHVKAMEGLKERRDAALKAKGDPASGIAEPEKTRGRSVHNSQQEKTNKGKETPVVNASVLLSNFKRRPRQSSILRHTADSEQEDTGLESIGLSRSRELSVDSIQHRNIRSKLALGLDSSLLRLGNFKRRARQGSILQRSVDNEQNKNSDEDDDDGFNPEDESTPLNLSKNQSGPQQDSSPPLSSSLSLPGSNSRKRKLASPGVQVPHSSLPAPYLQRSGSESPLSSELGEGHETDHRPSRNQQHVTHPDWSITMAPPRSSSPSTQELDIVPDSQPALRQQPVVHKKSSQRQQPARKKQAVAPAEDEASGMSDRQSEEEEVVPAAAPSRDTRKKNTQKKAPAISTAALQNMLPRRRRRAARGEFDVLESSDPEANFIQLGPEVDELSVSILPSKKGRRKTQANTEKNRVEKGKTPAKKTPAPNRIRLGTPATKPPRTYGRRQSSDKENEEASSSVADEGDSLGPINSDLAMPDQRVLKKSKKELKKLAAKFREVDEWEMEFEEVTASSSSPTGDK